VGLAVAGCGVAGTLTAVLLSSGGDVAQAAPGSPPSAAAHVAPRGTPPPVPNEAGVVVKRPDGTHVTCPHGTEPGVSMNDAQFQPALTRATTFAPGRYRIRLVGAVANTTTGAIDVKGIRLTVDGRPWRGRVVAVKRLVASSSASLVVEGDYVARRAERVDIRAELDWRWTDPRLSVCGEKGLADDV
jgi:hypothetical protein